MIHAHKETALQFMRLVYKTQDDINQDRRLHQQGVVRLNTRERDLVDFVNVQTDLLKIFPTLEEELKVSVEPKVGKAKMLANKEMVMEWMSKQEKKVTADMILSTFKEVTGSLITKWGGMGALNAELKTRRRKYMNLAMTNNANCIRNVDI